MPSYRTSSGERVLKSVIDLRIHRAKELKLKLFFEEHGYYFCEDCGRSDKSPLDCSHDISVDQCQKSGRTELAWDVNNITLRCRDCHRKHDNNTIG